MRPRIQAHASLRRRRRRGVHWRPRVRSQRAGGQCSRRRSPDRAPCPRVRSWSGRRRPRPLTTSALSPSSGQGLRPTGRSIARPGVRSAPRPAAARATRARRRSRGLGRRGARVPASSLRARRGLPWTDGSPEHGLALRRYQRRRGLIADGIAGPQTYRSLAGTSLRRPGTSSDRARASSRSRRATTSAPGDLPGGTGSSSRR